MFERMLESEIKKALERSPVVLLNGARQTGKSTLVMNLLEGRSDIHYFSLDDASIASMVKLDPRGFLSRFEGLVVLDEIQNALELIPAIKNSVDKDRRPGRFLLMG